MRVFTALCLIFIGLSSYSKNTYSESFYSEVGTDIVLQSVDDERFRLGAADLRLGYYLLPQIGLEIYGGAGFTDDSRQGLTQNINSRYGVAARFESPSRDGTKAFILLGYANHELELERKSSGQTLVKEEFDGFSYGIGLEQQLFNTKSRWFLNARWQRFYSAGDIDIDAVGLGLRWVM